MHVAKLLGDRVLRSIFLLRQPLDSPNIRKQFADLLLDVVAILLGHSSRMQSASKNMLLPMYMAFFDPQDLLSHACTFAPHSLRPHIPGGPYS